MTKRYKTRVFDVLRANGISVKWFAGQIGINRSQLYQIESGDRPMPSDYIERAARILRVPEDMLLFLPRELSTLHHGKTPHNDEVPA